MCLKLKTSILIFKTKIKGIKTCLVKNNGSEVELIDEFFVCANKIPFFKLKELINFVLGNSKIVQKLTKKTFINIIIGGNK